MCGAIAEMNTLAKSTSVQTSPVKHLFRLNVPQGPGMYKMAALDAGTVAAAPAGGEVKDYAISFTGRVGNPMYDVAHFDLEVAVDAASSRSSSRSSRRTGSSSSCRSTPRPLDLGEALDLGCSTGGTAP